MIEIIDYIATTTDGSSSFITTAQFIIPFFLFQFFFAIIMITILVVSLYLFYRKLYGD